MSKTIEFYYDYSSPFGYLASERIEDLASRHDHKVVWHPVLLGAIFKVSNQVPLTEVPLKGEYSMRDFARSAREHNIAYTHPDPFPIGAVAACRATLWLRDNTDASLSSRTTDFVHAVFRAFYVEGRDITDVAVLGELASQLNIDTEKMTAALSEQSVKDALRLEVESAIAHGIFGAPYMIVDNEPFWGNDRLEQIDRWLSKGGW